MYRDYDKLQAEHGFTDAQIAELKAIDSHFAQHRADAESTYRRTLAEIKEDHDYQVAMRITQARIASAAEARDGDG